jgi:hypothetical protein
MRNSVVKKLRKLVKKTMSEYPYVAYKDIDHGQRFKYINNIPFQYEAKTRVLHDCQKHHVNKMKKSVLCY